MGLMQDATKWVLFLASPEEPEERHVLDLAFGLHCLESAGVSSENIEIYIDGDNRQNIISWCRLEVTILMRFFLLSISLIHTAPMRTQI